MPLNLIFTAPGNYTIEDNGIPGDNTSVIRDGTGAVVFTFVHPADQLGFTVSSPGVNLTINLTDSLGTANLTVGDLTSAAASPDSIAVGNVRTTGTVTLVSNGTITELGADAGADIIASQIVLSATTGVGTTANAIETQTSAIEAETGTGGINLGNFGAVQIGGITGNVDGLEVATSGNISFTNVGTILLGDDTGTESVRGGNTSGNVTLIAKGIDADIISNVDNDAITVPGGSISLQAGRDVGFGIIGTDFDNDVRARGSITIEAGRDFLIDGFADLASDDFLGATGGNVTITAGRNIHVRSVAGTDGSIFANGNAGADVILTTGANGAVVVDPASVTGAPQPIASNSGDVVANADRILIASTSGIGAPAGQVVLRPVTPGREILLGSAGDAAFALQLSDAELDRIFAPNITIGDNNSGSITVLGAISSAAQNITLRTAEDLLIGANLSGAGTLALRAGNNLFQTAGTINAGALNGFVDTVGGDGNTGSSGILGSVVATAATLDGAADNDTLHGAEGIAQTVHGNGGDDTIVSSGEGSYFGDAGNDLILAGLSNGLVPEVLDGGAGTDTLDTRTFNGNYAINMATGETNFDYESFVNFERIITGDGNDTITGTAGSNIIRTNNGADTINGGAGADEMIGGAGDDTYTVDNVGDKVIEKTGEGTDQVYSSVTFSLGGQYIERLTLTGSGNINGTGNSLANTLTGNAGNNALNGGAGADTMDGGAGNDTYKVDNAGDVVIEKTGEGTDQVNSSVSFSLGGQYIERLTLTGSGNIDALGNSLANTLTGNSGNNYLSGGSGADTMAGGAGNDTYKVDNAGDVVIEKTGEGTDQVNSSVSFSLGGQYIERLTLTGSGNIDALGNSLANTLTGNSGNNYLSGGSGADTMAGGAGNDTYKVDDAGDVVLEKTGEGTDQVNSSVSFSLGGQYIERLTLTGSGNINGTGNSLANMLIGNSGNNVLNGKTGADVMTGGGGSDTFAFTSDLVAGEFDTITDFNVTADTIRLSHAIFSTIVGTGTLSAAQFAANASGTAQDANDRIIYETDTGKLFFDSNGNAAGGSIQFAKLGAGLALTNADFVIV